MIQAVLFDLFGTVVFLNTDRRPYLQLAKRSPHFGVKEAISLSLSRDFSSLSAYADCLGAAQYCELNELDKLLQEDIASASLYDDVLPTLRTLKDKGLSLALVSNLATPYAEVVEQLGLAEYFDECIFSYKSGTIKPQPLIYQMALNALSVQPVQAIFVGDNFKADVKGPNSVGMRAVHLVRHPGESRHTSIHSLSELSRFIE